MNFKELSFSQALYDTNVIIYYCSHFSEELMGEKIDLCIIETERAHELTKELLELDKTIITLNLILDEIENKGIAKFIDDFCDKPEIMDKLGTDTIPDRLRQKFAEKMERKLRKLRANDWFDVVEYMPSLSCISILKQFYLSLDGTPIMMEHFHRKGNYNPIPSCQDRALLCYSSEFDVLLVSNDSDITDFITELKREGHCFEIFDLNECNV